MKTVRTHIASRFFAILTGIVFLNMSFFISEIRMLSLNPGNKDLVENIIKMISGIGFEEERDGADESAEIDAGEHVFDLQISIFPESTYSTFLLSSDLHILQQTSSLYAAPSEIVTPPPRQA
jgi:hypothetical protein